MSSKESKKVATGRPKSEEKRSAMLYAAGCEFLTKGYEAASIDAIAEMAGVSKATVYSHFKGKEDLFQNVIKGKVESYAFDGEHKVSDDPREGLCQIAMRLYELLNDDDVINMHRVVVGESMRHHDMAELFYKNGPQKTLDTIAHFLQGQADRKRLHIDNANQAASQYMYMVAGEMLMRSMMNLPMKMKKKDFVQHVENTTSQFLSLYQ